MFYVVTIFLWLLERLYIIFAAALSGGKNFAYISKPLSP